MRAIARALERARSTSSRGGKVSAIAEALRETESLTTAVRVCAGTPFSPHDPRTTGAGFRIVFAALVSASGASEDELGLAMRRHGDLGDAAFDVWTARGVEGAGFSLDDASALFVSLARDPSRGAKARLLTSALSACDALSAKYLTKTLLGDVRTGASEGVILLAIAQAFGRREHAVRAAYALVSDLAEAAVLARDDQLHTARIVAGRPVLPMLATPIEASKAPIDWSRVVVEDKLDGVRAQLHVGRFGVRIFARGQGDITRAFPDVVRALAEAQGELVLDGEIVAVSETGAVRPFQALQARLGRKDPPGELFVDVPAAFVAYDVLHEAGAALVALPWTDRRAALVRIGAELGLRVNEVTRVSGPQELDVAFERARARGQEGLMLKRTDAPYEAGARGAAWLKVKRAGGTLDVVVTAVEQGHGKRANVLSDYTFAIRSGDELLEVGKAYSGLTDVEIGELTTRFEELTLERRGGYRKVRPEVVLEVAFDGVQRSERHASGFALRFPRIVRVRADKTVAEVDTKDDVLALLSKQIESGHREERARPKRNRPKKQAPDASQLSLFGEPRRGR